jgi:hypothetical protein
MYSYEDGIRAVGRYIKLRKRLRATIRLLGYLIKNALKGWCREYQRRRDLSETGAFDRSSQHWVTRCIWDSLSALLRESSYPTSCEALCSESVQQLGSLAHSTEIGWRPRSSSGAEPPVFSWSRWVRAARSSTERALDMRSNPVREFGRPPCAHFSVGRKSLGLIRSIDGQVA